MFLLLRKPSETEQSLWAGLTPSNELTVVGSDDGETFWRLTGHKEGADPYDSSVR